MLSPAYLCEIFVLPLMDPSKSWLASKISEHSSGSLIPSDRPMVSTNWPFMVRYV